MPRHKETYPGTRFVSRGKIVIRIKKPGVYTVDGESVFHTEYTGLPDTPQGHQLALARHRVLYEQLYLGRGGEERIQRRCDEAFEEFLKAKTRNPNTVRTYRNGYDAVVGKSNPFLTDEFMASAVRKYLSTTAKKNGHTAVTMRTYIREFNAFHNYCIRRKYVSADTKDYEIQVPVDKERQDTVAGRFELHEIEPILKGCYAIDHEFGVLNEFMMLTGARPVDALTLVWSRVKFDKGTIVWQNKITKRDEERVVDERALELLRQLRGMFPDRDKVFRWKHSSLSRLSRHLTRAIEMAGLEKVADGNRNRSMKSWRVVFRSSLHHLPLELQRWLMRHKSLQVTSNNYTYFTLEEQTSALKTLVNTGE